MINGRVCVALAALIAFWFCLVIHQSHSTEITNCEDVRSAVASGQGPRPDRQTARGYGPVLRRHGRAGGQGEEVSLQEAWPEEMRPGQRVIALKTEHSKPFEGVIHSVVDHPPKGLENSWSSSMTRDVPPSLV